MSLRVLEMAVEHQQKRLAAIRLSPGAVEGKEYSGGSELSGHGPLRRFFQDHEVRGVAAEEILRCVTDKGGVRRADSGETLVRTDLVDAEATGGSVEQEVEIARSLLRRPVEVVEEPGKFSGLFLGSG